VAITSDSSLKRDVTTRALFMFVLGDVLGAGVYVLVGVVAAASGGAVWVPLLVALIMALLTAGSYAELATKYPRAGGSSHYATRAFGPFVGFLVGFCMLSAGIVSVGALALGFAGDYLSELITLPIPLTVIIFLGLLAALNAYGIRESMHVNITATIIEVSGLLLIVALGMMVIARGDADLSRLVQLGTPDNAPVFAVLAGTVLAYYSYVGFETSVNVAEEAKNPTRSYPIALFGALTVAGVVYVGVGVAASAVVSTEALAASSGPLLEVVRAAGWVPPVLFSVIALVAVANGALLTGIMSSRLAYGMSRDGLLPSFLSTVLPNRRTPGLAIMVTTVMSLALALIGSIEVLAATLVLLLLVVFIAVNSAVLVLRKDIVEHPHFRVPSVLPVLGIASCVVLVTQIEGETWLFGLPMLAGGAVLAAIARAQVRKGAATLD
jgi:basic amino acid/polyamine antiporter, APA family